MIRTKATYRRMAKALGIKHPRRFAAKMAEKQFDKYLPHGRIRQYEQALRAGDRSILRTI